MSHGPSTFGTMMTSSRSPISVTSWVRSSRTHGDSSALTRVQSCVSPSSISLPTRMRPSRAGILRSTGTASSRLPSRMSTVGAMSGTLETIFSFEKSRKWIIREGRNGISRSGSGASMARGLKKSRGLRIRWQLLVRRLEVREHREVFDVAREQVRVDALGGGGDHVADGVGAAVLPTEALGMLGGDRRDGVVDRHPLDERLERLEGGGVLGTR